jgi:hypothetical protein
MRNSRILHHRDVLRAICHNVLRVIIRYPLALPLRLFLAPDDCQVAALVPTRTHSMDMFQLYCVDL